jgi:hypothetical protein
MPSNPFSQLGGVRFNIPRLKAIPGVQAPKGWGLPRYGARARISDHVSPPSPRWLRANPEGTDAEYRMYRALQSMGLRPGQDFIYRANINGVVVDFLLVQRNVAIMIRDAVKRLSSRTFNESDPFQRAKLRPFGIVLVTLEEEAVMTDASRELRRAMAMRLAPL